MPCDAEMPTLLHGYVDGELSLLDSLRVERHLAECAECTARHAQLLALRHALRQEGLPYAAPPALRAKLDALFPAFSADHTAPAAAPPGRRLAWRLAYACAALLLIAAVIPALHWISHADGSAELRRAIIASHVRAQLVGRLTDVASSDQHTVKPWFSGKLDFSPPVADLASEGFPLVGGRIDYLLDRPVAALVYHRNKHIITLFLWPTTEGDSGVDPHEGQGFHLLHWTKAGMTCWAVSDVNQADLRQFAAEIARASASPEPGR